VDEMKTSSQDSVEGKLREVTGGGKEITGIVIGNKKLEVKGRAEKRAGKVQKKIGQVKKVLGR
jgi:uncharacterized protein YjbJ (UPF0337 family)